jgi:acyl dehydratase
MQALPPTSRLQARAALTLARRPGPGPAIPGATNRFAAPALDPAWLAAYHAYMGGFAAELPLAALFPLAQRAQLAAMLAPGFPHKLVGLVHLANEERLLATLDPAAGFAIEVQTEAVSWPEAPAWEVFACFVTTSQGETPVATCRSVYLARRVGRRTAPRPAEPAPAAEPWLAETWAFQADEGRRYAALSGDRNPIHLHPLLSRWFGFPRPILHGMDGVARAAASLERAWGRPLTALNARFDRPVPLPGQVAFRAWQAAPGQARFLLDGQARHVEGTARAG